MSSPELYGHGSFGFDKVSERIPERADQSLTSSRFESVGLAGPAVEAPVFEAPLFEAAGWSQLDGHMWEAGLDDRQVDVSYINAGTCPDCGNGMIRLGLCMTCPCCGYGSCGE